MKTKELTAMIKVGEELGHIDIPIFIDESRDGVTSHIPARAQFVKLGVGANTSVILLVGYEK